MAPWPTPPILPGGWTDVPDRDAVALAARLGSTLARHFMGLVWFTEIHRFRALPLPFARDWVLIEFEARLDDGDSGVAGFLYGPGRKIILLDLSSGPMYALAAQPEFALESDAAAVAFLRCFCGSIAAEGGRFNVVGSADELPLLPGDRTDAEAATLARIAPPTVSWIERPAQGDTPPERVPRVTACALYAGEMLRAVYDIRPHRVEMIDSDELGPVPARRELIRPPFRTLLSADLSLRLTAAGSEERADDGAAR